MIQVHAQTHREAYLFSQFYFIGCLAAFCGFLLLYGLQRSCAGLGTYLEASWGLWFVQKCTMKDLRSMSGWGYGDNSKSVCYRERRGFQIMYFEREIQPQRTYGLRKPTPCVSGWCKERFVQHAWVNSACSWHSNSLCCSWGCVLPEFLFLDEAIP